MGSAFSKKTDSNIMSKVAPLDINVVRQKYHSEPAKGAYKRLFMFDYDGTLTPIVSDPNAALPTENTLSVLRKLTEDDANSVWIVSGRDANFLETHWGHIARLGLSAEHGCYLKAPGETNWKTLVDTEELNKWQPTVLKAFDEATADTPGSNTERKVSAVTWHYRRAVSEEVGMKRAKQIRERLEKELQGQDVEIMEGKANLEVRPRSVSKGEIVKRIIAEQIDGEGVRMVVCAGDDRTDEDMFNALTSMSAPSSPAEGGSSGPRISRETVFTVHVGPKDSKTDARFYVETPADLIQTLDEIVKV